MKRFAILFILVFALTSICLAGNGKAKGQDKVVAGIYSSLAGDFSTKFWKEMMKGGGPGQPGNTLMAVGQGFHFSKAAIDANGAQCPSYPACTTVYEGGDLVLNSKGPWLNAGILKATGIVATNQSISLVGGCLDFNLTFSGEFDNMPGLFFEVEATYSGCPELKFDGSGNLVLQRGSEDFEATINIY